MFGADAEKRKGTKEKRSERGRGGIEERTRDGVSE
jgi:hypothetical protein